MRFNFNILLFATFLVTLATGLPIVPSNDVQERDLLVSRANPFHGAGAAAKRLISRVRNKKPDRTSTFHVPAAHGKPDHVWTGQDVRNAMKHGKAEAKRLETASNRQKKKSTWKVFGNRPHDQPHANGVGGDRPLPHSHADPRHPFHEFPLPNHHEATHPGLSPARVITQEVAPGKHIFKGVIAHDQSRVSGTHGYNDHFEVHEQKHASGAWTNLKNKLRGHT